MPGKRCRRNNWRTTGQFNDMFIRLRFSAHSSMPLFDIFTQQRTVPHLFVSSHKVTIPLNTLNLEIGRRALLSSYTTLKIYMIFKFNLICIDKDIKHIYQFQFLHILQITLEIIFQDIIKYKHIETDTCLRKLLCFYKLIHI